MNRLSLRHLHLGCGESLQARRAIKPKRKPPADEAKGSGAGRLRALATPTTTGKDT